MRTRHARPGAEWDRIEGPLPRHGPEGDRRLLVGALPYVARAGIPWDDLPARFGEPDTVWKRFDRRARTGVWERVFEALRGPGVEWPIPDSTTTRAPPRGAGAQKERATRPSGAAAAGRRPGPGR